MTQQGKKKHENINENKKHNSYRLCVGFHVI